MNDIKWEDGAVFCADNTQYRVVNNNAQYYSNGWIGSAHPVNWLMDRSSFQLNEIIQGDYIEASELDTEQKYNDAVEVFELFGFEPYLNRGIDNVGFITHAVEKSLGLIADSDGDLVLDYGNQFDIEQRKRKITYPQLMAIGKLKRAMIERDEVACGKISAALNKLPSSLKNAEWPDLTKYPSNPSESPSSSDWSDEHYNHFYKLTKDDIKAGQIKVDAYFVNRMWKINSWEDTGAGFHILKTFPRIANNKNSLKRELVALKKQVDILCKLHGVDDGTAN